MAAKSKIEELKQKLTELQQKYRGAQKEISDWRAKVVQLTDSNMNYYGHSECNKLTKLFLHDYQKLIFCELQRANEINAEVLNLIHPKTKHDTEVIEIAQAELQQIRSDALEYKIYDETDFISSAEKQITAIVNILQAKIKELKCKADKNEDMKSFEIKAQQMIASLDYVLHPERCQLDDTIERTESSSSEEVKDENPKIRATISRTQSGKQSVAEAKVNEQAETIKQKDAMIEELYLSVGKRNTQIEGLEKALNDKNNRITSLEVTLNELQKIDEENMEQLRVMEETLKRKTEDEKNLKALLDSSNEENVKLVEVIKKLEEQPKTEELNEELNKKEIMITKLEQQLDEQKNSEESRKLNIKISDLIGEIENLNKAYHEALQLKKEAEQDRNSLITRLKDVDTEKNRLLKEVFKKEEDYNMIKFNIQEHYQLKEEHQKCQQLLKKSELEVQKIMKKMEAKDETTHSESSSTSTNPFATDMKKNGKNESNFWYRETKRTMRELEQQLMEKDGQIEMLTRVRREWQRPKTPRSNMTSPLK